MLQSRFLLRPLAFLVLSTAHAASQEQQFFGQLLDPYAATPVADAVLTLYGAPDGEGHRPVLGHSAGDLGGRFRIPAMADWDTPTPPWPDVVEIRAPGYGPRWIRPERDATSREHPQVVPMSESAILSLELSCPGVRVHRLHEQASVMRVTALARPDEIGPMFVGHSGASPQEEEILESIRDRMREEWEEQDDDDPEKEQTFSYPEPVLYGLPAAMHLTISLGFGDQVIQEKVCVLNPGFNERSVELKWPGRVRGTMRDQNGDPVPHWPVALSHRSRMEGVRPNCDPFLIGATDAQGEFEMPVPEGEWWLGPACGPCHLDELEGHRPEDEERDRWVDSFGVWLNVPPGDVELHQDLDVGRGLKIRGLLVREDGRHSGGMVGVLNERAPYHSTFLMSVGDRPSDGAVLFELGPLPPGKHRVAANCLAYYGPPVEAEAGGDIVKVPMRPACRLRGNVLDPSQESGVAADLWVFKDQWDLEDAQRHGHSLRDGSFVHGNLPPGPAHFFLRSKDDTLTGWFEVNVPAPTSDAQFTELTWTLEPARRLVLDNRSASRLEWRLLFEGHELYSPAMQNPDDEGVGPGRLDAGASVTFVLPSGHAELELRNLCDPDRFAQTRTVELGPDAVTRIEWWGDR